MMPAGEFARHGAYSGGQYGPARSDLGWQMGLAAQIFAAFLCLLMFSEGPITMFLVPGGGDADGTPLMRMLWYPVYLVALILAALHARQVGLAAWRNPLMILTIVLAGLSAAWSLHPDVTVRRTIALAMTVLFGLWMGARMSWRDLIAALAITYLVLAVLSFLFAVLPPRLGVMKFVHPGAWSGVWTEKNTLGGHMARGAVFLGVMFLVDIKRWWFWGAGLALCGLLVLLSTSKTALLGMALGGLVVGGLWLAQRGPVLALGMLWLAGTAGVAALLVVTFGIGPVLEALGREATFTGRTDIWEVIDPYLKERPLQGWGYGVFFFGETGPVAWIRMHLDWPVPNAHNGFLEIWLGLGLIGVILVSAQLFWTLVQAFGHLGRHFEAAAVIGFMATLLLFSFSESVLLQQNTLNWVVVAALAARASVPTQPRPAHPLRYPRPSHQDRSVGPAGRF